MCLKSVSLKSESFNLISWAVLGWWRKNRRGDLKNGYLLSWVLLLYIALRFPWPERPFISCDDLMVGLNSKGHNLKWSKMFWYLGYFETFWWSIVLVMPIIKIQSFCPTNLGEPLHIFVAHFDNWAAFQLLLHCQSRVTWRASFTIWSARI